MNTRINPTQRGNQKILWDERRMKVEYTVLVICERNSSNLFTVNTTMSKHQMNGGNGMGIELNRRRGLSIKLTGLDVSY